MSTQFSVQTDTFQGPLELLLDLVERRKLFVNEVSLARVADDYVHYIESRQKLPLAQTAQFLVVASTLLLIKSRSLLPNLHLTDGEEEDIKQLEERLALYQEIRAGAGLLQQTVTVRALHSPLKAQPAPSILTKPTDLSISGLHSAIRNIIKEFPTFIKNPEVVVDKIRSLPEVVESLAQRIKKEIHLSFASATKQDKKPELIVTFLALLELVRRGTITVSQHAKFGDIDMQVEDMSIPSY